MEDHTYDFIPDGHRLLKYSKVEVKNLVATTNFGLNLVLPILNMIMKCALVRKTRFPASDIHLSDGYEILSGLVFATSNATGPGKDTINGTVFQLRQMHDYMERMITDNYTNMDWVEDPRDHTVCQFLKQMIRNVVIAACFKYGLDISGFKQKYPLNVSYYPDVFPGAIYTPMYVQTKSNIRALIFQPGRVGVVGAPTIESATQVLIEVSYVLVGFEKNNVDVQANNRFVAEYQKSLSSRISEGGAKKSVRNVGYENDETEKEELRILNEYGLLWDNFDDWMAGIAQDKV